MSAPGERPHLRVKCQAILFDMDGTLIDSTKCVESLWGAWGARHGIAVEKILAVSHGRRSIDTIRDLAPDVDAESDAAWLEAQEIDFRDGIEVVPGAAALLTQLPRDRWALITSASRELASVRMSCAGLPVPAVLVGSDCVNEGKPSPEGYLRAAEMMGLAPADCLVVEDAPAGIQAGLAAGMRVIGITTTYPPARLPSVACIADFSGSCVKTVIDCGRTWLEVEFAAAIRAPSPNRERVP